MGGAVRTTGLNAPSDLLRSIVEMEQPSGADRPDDSSANRVRPPLLHGPELRIFLAVAVFLFVSRVDAIVPAWESGDDLTHVHYPLHWGTPWSVYGGQGRLGLATLFTLLMKLGIDPVLSSPFLVLLAFALMASGGVFLARLWSLDHTPVLGFLAAALFLAHPYQMDHWYYRFMPVFVALTQVLAFLAAWLIARRRRPVAGAGLLILACSIFQTAVAYSVCALLGGALVEIARDRERRPWEIVLRLVGPLGWVAGATAAYLLAANVTQRWFGFQRDPRFGMLALADVPRRLIELRDLIARVLFHEGSFVAPLLQPFLLGSAAALVVVLAIRSLRGRGLAAPVAAVAVAIAGVAASVSISLPLRGWWPTWRTVTPLALTWSAVLVALCIALPGRWRAVGGTATVLVLASYLGISARISSESAIVTLRDRATLLRVLRHLERLPSFAGVRRVAIIGAPWAQVDVHTTMYELNQSLLSIPWAQVSSMRHLWGLPLDPPTPAEWEHATAACGTMTRFPAEGSVRIEGPLAFACF